MNLVQLFADGGLVVVVAASFVMAVLWLVREKPLVSVVLPYVVMAGLTSLLAGKLMGFWQPEAVRPFVEQGVAAGAAYIDNPGFPSDHVLLAVVVVGVVVADQMADLVRDHIANRGAHESNSVAAGLEVGVERGVPVDGR